VALVLPARFAVRRGAQDLEHALDPEERDEQVVILGRRGPAALAVRGDEAREEGAAGRG
jgi:hypothetical protein